MKNKKLEAYFNLPENENNIPSIIEKNVNNLSFTEKENNEKELNEIKELALRTYNDLIDAGFGCDPKFSSNFFEPASKIMQSLVEIEKTKITNKINKQKLKLDEKKIKLLKRKLDIEEKRNKGSYIELTENNGIYVDRNELLRQFLNKDDK